jgi:multidrug efflux pump subunit AcrA (membrane-fusion protein)
MRFMMRSLSGIFIIALTLSLLGFAAGRMMTSMQEREARGDRQRPAQEREFTVNVETLQLTTTVPTITTFGEVRSWRELELRAAASGVVVELSDQFRDGGRIAQGEVIYRIDPEDAKSNLVLAKSQVKEAEAELIEARAALELAQGDLDAAITQKTLREQALTRQNDLKSRGVGSDAAVEQASLSLSSAIQTELARKQSLAQAQARILRAEIGLQRQQIAQSEAERRLEDTVARAPFDGIVSGVDAIVGRLVSNNEQLGTMIDPSALEIAFRVSNAQFARLIDENGAIDAVDVIATLDLEDAPIVVSAKVDRAGAQVGDGQTGRIVYARIGAAEGVLLRQGDFMRVEIEERALDNVALVPSSALTSDGEILLLEGEDRLVAHQAQILRRQGDNLIIGSVPDGAEYVTRRTPQIGAGVKVKPVRSGAQLEEKRFVEISDEERQKFITAIEGNAYIPKDAKARIIANLNKEKVPAETVERLRARMGGGDESGEGEGETETALVKLDADRQAKLIAFVESNDRMPAEIKDRILSALRSGEAPADMIERIEQRMGS